MVLQNSNNALAKYKINHHIKSARVKWWDYVNISYQAVCPPELVVLPRYDA